MYFSNTPELETERLILRKFTENDIEALFVLLSDREVNTFLPWLPMKTFEETFEYYKKNFYDCYQSGQSYKYAVCLKTDNVPIRYVQLSSDESSHSNTIVCFLQLFTDNFCIALL